VLTVWRGADQASPLLAPSPFEADLGGHVLGWADAVFERAGDEADVAQ
jgi:hypothetical protein